MRLKLFDWLYIWSSYLVRSLNRQPQSNQGAPTDIADLFGNVSSDVGDVPHGHEWVKAGHFLCLLDVRLVREAKVMSDGCQKHLHADNKILRRKGQLERQKFLRPLKPRAMSWMSTCRLTCNPVATASTLFHSQVRLSEITPTFTSRAMATACLERKRDLCLSDNKQISGVWLSKNQTTRQ